MSETLGNRLHWRDGDGGFALHYGRRTGALLRVEPDATHPNMWRVKFADGVVSDFANLTWAKEAGRARALAILNQKSRPSISDREAPPMRSMDRPATMTVR